MANPPTTTTAEISVDVAGSSSTSESNSSVGEITVAQRSSLGPIGAKFEAHCEELFARRGMHLLRWLQHMGLPMDTPMTHQCVT